MKRDGSLWLLDGGSHRGIAIVTRLVQNLVTNNQLNCIANSDTLDGDPEFGVKKHLQLTYQIYGTTAVTNIIEDKPVHLGTGDSTLTITRALYGDPRKFSAIDQFTANELLYQPTRLRRINLDKQIVAFCGGRHGLGVALTKDGEVWQWGESLDKIPRQTRRPCLHPKMAGHKTTLGPNRPRVPKSPNSITTRTLAVPSAQQGQFPRAQTHFAHTNSAGELASSPRSSFSCRIISKR